MTTCKHCGQRIVNHRTSIGHQWTHQPDGASFQDGMHTYCHTTTAAPNNPNDPEQPQETHQDRTPPDVPEHTPKPPQSHTELPSGIPEPAAGFISGDPAPEHRPVSFSLSLDPQILAILDRLVADPIRSKLAARVADQ